MMNIFNNKKAFVGFVVGGDGGIDYCVDCCLQLIEGGVNILEIGYPFSEPVADGPIIQKASQRSLENGTNSKTILEIAQQIRKKSTIPLILFTYCNPIIKQGPSYLKKLRMAGFDGVLTVDLPETEHSYYRTLKGYNLQPIFVASPSTDESRLQSIIERSEGFIYYACQKGTTGIQKALPDDFAFHISRIKQRTSIPIVAGFGIGNRENAIQALNFADGFVVGSAFVNLMEKRANPNELKLFAQNIDPTR